tara:strand:- start:14043 stop:14255 length:213 start_codon:yes stop_codon:yes gene_type:complete
MGYPTQAQIANMITELKEIVVAQGKVLKEIDNKLKERKQMLDKMPDGRWNWYGENDEDQKVVDDLEIRSR